MKHIIKVEVLENLPTIRPLIAMDRYKNLFQEGKKELVGPADNEIWYWGEYYDLKNVISILGYQLPYKGPVILSNKQVGDKYVITFEEPVTKLGSYIDEEQGSAEFYPIFMNNPDMGIACNITRVEIPNSITHVGSAAFAWCNNLASVNIPNSVTSIGDAAFSDCTSLTSVTIGNSVTSIGYEAFYGCTSLTSITIPNSVTSIGEYAFSSCKSLTSATIGNGVTSIGEHAFYNCSSLTSITIPNSVTSIGDFAFDDVPNIEYHGSATGSPWGAKCLNGYVEGSLVYQDSTKTTLVSCQQTATNIIIPSSVTKIGNGAFFECFSLTSITIPNSVTSIGSEAFTMCTSLTSIHITDLAAWCKISFSTHNANPLYLARNLYLNGELVKDLVIPNSATNIGFAAFFGYSSLTSITIPESVTSIGRDAFANCESLTSVHITDLAAWCNIDFKNQYSNPLYYTHNLYLNNELVKDLVIPNDVTSIGYRAFADCSSLTSITIPNSVASIGYSAFYGCESLTSVTCEALTPPALDGTAVFDSTNNCPIYVPIDSVDTYKVAENWSEYASRIQAIQ